jgi:fructose-specific phosphotransferase system IIA component
MHKNIDYLQTIVPLIRKEDIPDVTIVERNGLGSLLEGDSADGISFQKGRLSNEYNKALIALIDDEKKIKEIMNQIENDMLSRWENLNDRAFVFTLPYAEVKHLEEGSFYARKKEREGKMRLYEYLNEDNISLDVKGQTKDEVIRELAELLKKEKEIVNFEGFVSAVFARESLASTGIGYEIAVPHARTDTVKDVIIAFGRSRKGINFDSIDGRPVKLVFLIGTPEKKKINAYLKLLAHLSRILKKEDFRERLLEASSPKEILDEFRKVES